MSNPSDWDAFFNDEAAPPPTTIARDPRDPRRQRKNVPHSRTGRDGVVEKQHVLEEQVKESRGRQQEQRILDRELESRYGPISRTSTTTGAYGARPGPSKEALFDRGMSDRSNKRIQGQGQGPGQGHGQKRTSYGRGLHSNDSMDRAAFLAAGRSTAVDPLNNSRQTHSSQYKPYGPPQHTRSSHSNVNISLQGQPQRHGHGHNPPPTYDSYVAVSQSGPASHMHYSQVPQRTTSEYPDPYRKSSSMYGPSSMPHNLPSGHFRHANANPYPSFSPPPPPSEPRSGGYNLNYNQQKTQTYSHSNRRNNNQNDFHDRMSYGHNQYQSRDGSRDLISVQGQSKYSNAYQAPTYNKSHHMDRRENMKRVERDEDMLFDKLNNHHPRDISNACVYCIDQRRIKGLSYSVRHRECTRAMMARTQSSSPSQLHTQPLKSIHASQSIGSKRKRGNSPKSEENEETNSLHSRKVKQSTGSTTETGVEDKCEEVKIIIDTGGEDKHDDSHNDDEPQYEVSPDVFTVASQSTKENENVDLEEGEIAVVNGDNDSEWADNKDRESRLPIECIPFLDTSCEHVSAHILVERMKVHGLLMHDANIPEELCALRPDWSSLLKSACDRSILDGSYAIAPLAKWDTACPTGISVTQNERKDNETSFAHEGRDDESKERTYIKSSSSNLMPLEASLDVCFQSGVLIMTSSQPEDIDSQDTSHITGLWNLTTISRRFSDSNDNLLGGYWNEREDGGDPLTDRSVLLKTARRHVLEQSKLDIENRWSEGCR